MKVLAVVLSVLCISFNFLYSQSSAGNDPQYISFVPNSQISKNISNEEKRLDEVLRSVYDSMQVHARLIPMKIKDLPRHTLITKGKTKGNECVEDQNQEDISNDCLKVEIFDFVGPDLRSARGSKSKSMTLFFDSSGGDPNPRTAPPRKLNKVKLKSVMNDLLYLDKQMLEVLDEDPLAPGDHNDKITIVAQYDDRPETFNQEKPSEYSYGKYKLSQVDNTKSSPIRNEFKRENYFKHLRYFHEMYTKIYDFNDLKIVNRVKENNSSVQKSLKY
jgi:hypothetical protein